MLGIAARFGAASGGAFCVRRPDGSLDTDGVVKGWAAQRAADTLIAAGLTTFCLNAGGDVVVRGEPEPGQRLARRRARPGRPAVVPHRARGARRGRRDVRHVRARRARLGRPHRASAATGLLAATVVAADLTTADVLATCVLALGPDGIAWAAEHGAAAVLAVGADGELLTGLQAAPA